MIAPGGRSAGGRAISVADRRTSAEGRWRCFVAVPLTDALRASLRAAAEEWRARQDLAGLAWADPAGWHVTLAFLGAVDAGEVPRVVAALGRAVGACEPSDHDTGGVGGFPSAARARVAWYGVADPEERLAALARAVRDAIGVEGAASFRPHVTLARARSAAIDLRPWVRSADPPAGRLVVDEVHLMRSHLGRGPARYESLAVVPTQRSAAVGV